MSIWGKARLLTILIFVGFAEVHPQEQPMLLKPTEPRSRSSTTPLAIHLSSKRIGVMQPWSNMAGNAFCSTQGTTPTSWHRT
jgi:hypothetical protein